MKHKVIVAVSVFLVLVLALVSAQSYHQHKQNRDAAAAKQASAAEVRYKNDAVKIKVLEGDVKKLQAECQNYSNAFTQLPVAVKVKTTTPDCTTVQVQ